MTRVVTEIIIFDSRYEVDTLKQACEHALLPHIDDESVLYFLSMADQVHAKTLRVSFFISLYLQHRNENLGQV